MIVSLFNVGLFGVQTLHSSVLQKAQRSNSVNLRSTKTVGLGATNGMMLISSIVRICRILQNEGHSYITDVTSNDLLPLYYSAE
jgi:hypothetical protein